jgi:Ca2+-binding RTX toxin-like protein
MATVDVYNPLFSFTSSPSRHWTVNSANADRLVYESNGEQLIVLGHFTIGATGSVDGGAVNSVSWKESADIGTASVRVSDLLVDAKSFSMLVAAATTDQPLLTLLLVGNDTITGTEAADNLQGFSGNDIINSGAGNDQIWAGSGSDIIDGGAGFDVVHYNGILADFKVDRVGSHYTVAHLNGDNGIDNLANVERVYFADKEVALVSADSSGGQLFRMYQAAFGRAPDAAGLDYWTKVLDSKSMKLQDVASGFVQSSEYRALYGANQSNHDLVAKFYEHILHRGADAGGLDYWTGVLDNHAASVTQVLTAISESPESVALSVTLIGSGIVMDLPLMTI